MRAHLRILFAMVSIALVSTSFANDRGVTALTLAGESISIDYGRPTLTGRDLLALARPGLVWRLGMNQATTLSSSADLDFGGTLVRRGQYSLFAKKESAKEWVLHISSQIGLWGTSGYDEKSDVAAIPLRGATLSQPIDQLTILLERRSENRGDLAIRWGEKELRTSFQLAR